MSRAREMCTASLMGRTTITYKVQVYRKDLSQGLEQICSVPQETGNVNIKAE